MKFRIALPGTHHIPAADDHVPEAAQWTTRLQAPDFHRILKGPVLKRRTAHELELDTGSRVISLPCNPDTIRGYSGVNLLVIDEAALVPDDLYHTVRPMLAVSRGRLALLSTPCGQRGFFYDAWARGGSDWTRIKVPAQQVPRISAATGSVKTI